MKNIKYLKISTTITAILLITLLSASCTGIEGDTFDKLTKFKSTQSQDIDAVSSIFSQLTASQYLDGWKTSTYIDSTCIIADYDLRDNPGQSSGKTDYLLNSMYMFMLIDDIEAIRINLSTGTGSESMLFVKNDFEKVMGKLADYADRKDKWNQNVVSYAESYSKTVEEEFLTMLISLENYDIYVASIPEDEILDIETQVVYDRNETASSSKITDEIREEASIEFLPYLRLCRSFKGFFTEKGMETFILNREPILYTSFIQHVNPSDGAPEQLLYFSNDIVTDNIRLTEWESTEYETSIMNIYDYAVTYTMPDGRSFEVDGRYHLTVSKGQWPKLGIRNKSSNVVKILNDKNI